MRDPSLSPESSSAGTSRLALAALTLGLLATLAGGMTILAANTAAASLGFLMGVACVPLSLLTGVVSLLLSIRDARARRLALAGLLGAGLGVAGMYEGIDHVEVFDAPYAGPDGDLY
ncbi:MAG: hypothetical protein H6741_05835 [Alphaproteobacteria bacterium]|nr:hypothetical protein [Alphaproteobacteria bacterium]MCB9792228.1 hypothetical protein [Alphaproteobacteria bacterium]